MTIDTS